mgnify:CR=1 FL=1
MFCVKQNRIISFMISRSFFSSLKNELVHHLDYHTRDQARTEIFEYIEMFYNPKRKNVRNGMLSPVDFERQREMTAEGV